MRNSEFELCSEEELMFVKRNRIVSMISGDDINELVKIINDYSVYSLFEPIMLMPTCSDDYNTLEKTKKNNSILDEENICRRKVYHFLKDSGYDDFYIEDNIEKYTKILLNFYNNPDSFFNRLDIYNSLFNYESDKKVKIRKVK